MMLLERHRAQLTALLHKPMCISLIVGLAYHTIPNIFISHTFFYTFINTRRSVNETIMDQDFIDLLIIRPLKSIGLCCMYWILLAPNGSPVMYKFKFKSETSLKLK